VSDAARAAGRRTLLAAALLLSAGADTLGGLWAVFDWKGVSAFMADTVPDWEKVGRAARLGLDGGSLQQLWANLGSALVALGAAQALAAWWVGQGKAEGIALARLVGYALVVAALLMAGPGGQRSSLLTEGARGVVILFLVLRASPRG
jgi:hypothetical protein